jgi:hypothetical protein
VAVVVAAQGLIQHGQVQMVVLVVAAAITFPEVQEIHHQPLHHKEILVERAMGRDHLTTLAEEVVQVVLAQQVR